MEDTIRLTPPPIPLPFRRITAQNHRLLAAMEDADFDGFTKLDPTLNQAVTYIHQANEVIVAYPQGSFPLHLAFPMVYSTLHLLRACERRYGIAKVKAMQQAFHMMFRLWYYSGEPLHPANLFAKKLFRGEEKLIAAICEHNRGIVEPPHSPRTFRAPDKICRARTRAAGDALTQAEVARDFGVSRQQVGKWEARQTADGPSNAANPYGYYKSLRTDPKLRDAYSLLANQAKAYNRLRAAAAAKGERFKIAFVRFQEQFLAHNKHGIA